MSEKAEIIGRVQEGVLMIEPNARFTLLNTIRVLKKCPAVVNVDGSIQVDVSTASERVRESVSGLLSSSGYLVE